eukprot:jgi/Psemu1/285769/fgenesh1_pg.101_\
MIRKLFVLLFSLCLTGSSHLIARAAITGEVLSLFLKGNVKEGIEGEIQRYANVTIKWIRGKKAVLSIFDDNGKPIEAVQLYKLKTREEMHKLMVEKGFVKKSKGQVVAEIKAKNIEEQLLKLESPMFYKTMYTNYMLVLVMTAVAAFLACCTKRRRRPKRMAGGTDAFRV